MLNRDFVEAIVSGVKKNITRNGSRVPGNFKEQ